jgi:hypothetical protein
VALHPHAQATVTNDLIHGARRRDNVARQKKKPSTDILAPKIVYDV